MGINLSREQRTKKLLGWQWDYALQVLANAQLQGIVSNTTCDKKWFLCRDAGVIGQVIRNSTDFTWEVFRHDYRFQPDGPALAMGFASMEVAVNRLLAEMTYQYLNSVSDKINGVQPIRAGERPSRKKESAF